MDPSPDERRTTHALRLEIELARYQERLREAFGVGEGDRVLDIGCGAGATTRDAARAAHRGGAHGVDLAAPVIATARRLAAAEGLRNATFEQADAQTHPFPLAHFDLGISRFGTMFFPEPVTAFANVGRALRSRGRLAQLVWQAGDRQEWATAIGAALSPGSSAPVTGEPFSLAEPRTVREILTAAGFADVEVTELSEPVHCGSQPEAYDFVLGLELARNLLARLAPEDVPAAHDRLRAVLAAHDTGAGVWFDSRAWLVTAVRV